MTTKTEKKTPSRAARSILRGLKQAAAHERGEGEAIVHEVPAPVAIDVARLRADLEMSQATFAKTFGLTKRAL